jgi:hypothetical protein
MPMQRLQMQMHAGRSYRQVFVQLRISGQRANMEKIRADKTYLILDQELDTLDWSSCGLGDGGGDTTHCYRRSAFTPCEIRCRKPHLSPPDQSDGDNNRSTLAKVDILKKSITKGGLLKRRSA